MRRSGCLVAILVVLAAYFTNAAIRYPHNPWPQLNRVLRTYPVPKGFEYTGKNEQGSSCSWIPFASCDRPREAFLYRTRMRADDACRVFVQSFRRWRGMKHFEGDSSMHDPSVDPCGYQQLLGHVQGYAVDGILDWPDPDHPGAGSIEVQVSAFAHG